MVYPDQARIGIGFVDADDDATFEADVATAQQDVSARLFDRRMDARAGREP